MLTGPAGGSGGGSSTCSVAVEKTPLGAVARISTSPELCPVARPDALTVAIASSLLDHVNATPGTGACALSNAVASNCCVAPSMTVALAGVISTLATSAGSSLSLQTLNELAIGPVHTLSPAPLRCSDWPTGSAPFSLTGM